jgi:hypothetical protein
LPILSLERLEELAREIMTNGNPYRVLAEIENEKLAHHLERFNYVINPEQVGC